MWVTDIPYATGEPCGSRGRTDCEPPASRVSRSSLCTDHTDGGIPRQPCDCRCELPHCLISRPADACRVCAHRFRCSFRIALPHGRDDGVVLRCALRDDTRRFRCNAPKFHTQVMSDCAERSRTDFRQDLSASDGIRGQAHERRQDRRRACSRPPPCHRAGQRLRRLRASPRGSKEFSFNGHAGFIECVDIGLVDRYQELKRGGETGRLEVSDGAAASLTGFDHPQDLQTAKRLANDRTASPGVLRAVPVRSADCPPAFQAARIDKLEQLLHHYLGRLGLRESGVILSGDVIAPRITQPLATSSGRSSAVLTGAQRLDPGRDLTPRDGRVGPKELQR